MLTTHMKKVRDGVGYLKLKNNKLTLPLLEGFFISDSFTIFYIMEDNSKEKIYVDSIIYQAQKETPFIWRDIKHIEFEDDDVIRFDYVEDYYTDYSSYPAYYSGMVIRKVEETDEQYKRRQERIARNEDAKQRRYQEYLRLKEEFENE